MDTVISLQDTGRGVIQFQKFLIYLTRFVTFWTRLSLKRLVMLLIFQAFFLPLILGKIIRSWLCSFHKTIKYTALLVRFIFTVITKIWYRFSSYLYLVYHSLWVQGEVAKLKLASSLVFRSVLCHILVIHLQQGSCILKCNLRVMRIAGNHLVVDQVIQQILRWKEAL